MMQPDIRLCKQNISIDIERVAGLIANTQKKSGEIPWCEGEKTDPWDHIEAAMGLGIGGYLEEARRAYHWLGQLQLDDGSWYTAYVNGVPVDKTRDTNFSAYIAVGVFHYYLMTGDFHFLKEMWPSVRSAMTFVLDRQGPGGEIYWAVSPEGKIDATALLTGSSSIYTSIKCATAIAKLLNITVPKWQAGLVRLRHALVSRPDLFDKTKSRYSMDWFYPILSGAVTGLRARQRIEKFWDTFVIDNKGVRCVADQPWVTVAETCELSLALSAMGNTRLSETVFGWIRNRTNPDGSYWCGFTCPDMTVWPKYNSTWTNAAVLIAADAIYEITSACRLFNHRFWRRPLKNVPF
jgi:hypothetical protein